MTTPKDNFLSSQDKVKKHHDLIERPEFIEAMKVAMAHYCQAQSKLGNSLPGEAFYRIQGAHEFLDVFLTLGDQRKPQSNRPLDNLKSNQ